MLGKAIPLGGVCPLGRYPLRARYVAYTQGRAGLLEEQGEVLGGVLLWKDRPGSPGTSMGTSDAFTTSQTRMAKDVYVPLCLFPEAPSAPRFGGRPGHAKQHLHGSRSQEDASSIAT